MPNSNTLKNIAIATTTAAVVAVGGADMAMNDVSLDCNVHAAPIQQLDNVLRTAKVDTGLLQARDMTAKDRANIKGCEIAKLVSVGIYTVDKDTKEVTRPSKGKPVIPKANAQTTGSIEIEVTGVEPIVDGLQVFARVWDNGNQIGFGPDGSVDIERFTFTNPPILVDDPAGEIVQISSYTDPDTGEEITSERRLTEDPELAILLALEKVLSVKTERFDAANIESGKVGNTTSTFYSSSGDGWTGHYSASTWAGDHDATTADSGQLNYTTADSEGVNVHYTNDHIRRAYLPFDTSSLPDTDTISSATLSAYTLTNSWSGSVLDGVAVFESPQTSETALASADYNVANWGSTMLSSENSFVASNNWQDFTLNASGIAFIDKTGVSFFGVRIKNDYDNTEPPAGATGYQRFRYSEYTGTASDPVLVVEHTGGAAPARRIIRTTGG